MEMYQSSFIKLEGNNHQFETKKNNLTSNFNMKFGEL